MRFIFLITAFCCSCVFAQTISSVPGTYTDKTFLPTDVNTLINNSLGFTALPKITAISSTNVTLGSETWPEGSWGRGYHTTPASTHDIFYTTTADDQEQPGDNLYYRAHRPLMRDVSAFFRGHLHLYLNGYQSADQLEVIEDGIDYMLTQQYQSGASEGAFVYWWARAGQTNISMDISANGPNPYETAYALAALSEYYLSGIDYLREDVLDAIYSAQEYLVNTDFYNPTNDNTNIRALAIWSLSISYKVTRNCDAFNKLKILTYYLIDNQTNNGTGRDGMWEMGGIEGSECQFYHDTKIAYHFYMIRALVEVFDVIPDEDASFKSDAVGALKRAINHVILKRRGSDLAGDSKLKYLFIDIYGNDINTTPICSASSGSVFEPAQVECWLDAMAKLTYYSSTSPFFTATERANIRELTNKLAVELSVTEKWHICAIGTYKNYLDAVNNSTTVLPWGGASMNYNPNKIDGTTVTADFDNDGDIDDIAAFYDYGALGTKIHVWTSEEDHFDYSGANGWWSATSYTATQVTDRVVAGDFDNDSFFDDIAAFYDDGGGVTKIHVWLSDGDEFIYQTGNGWWNVSGYTAGQITNRVVSGDFDNDGFEDDIAAFYDYSGGVTKLHVWTSNVGSFTYYGTGWWSTTAGSYYPSQINGRVVSGDFDRDGSNDDIAAFNDYTGGVTKLHMWIHSGVNTFTYYGNGWWSSASGTYTPLITDRVVSGDFDGDTFKDDIAAFYDYGGTGSTKIHVWRGSTVGSMTYYGSGWWSVGSGYESSQVTNRVVAGDFNSDGADDIAVFYKYGTDRTRIHRFLKVPGSNSFSYKGPTSAWLPCWTPPAMYGRSFLATEEEMIEESETPHAVFSIEETTDVIVFPNPSSGTFFIDPNSAAFSNISQIIVYDVTGKEVYNRQSDFGEIQMDGKGVYLMVVQLKTNQIIQKKIVVI